MQVAKLGFEVLEISRNVLSKNVIIKWSIWVFMTFVKAQVSFSTGDNLIHCAFAFYLKISRYNHTKGLHTLDI